MSAARRDVLPGLAARRLLADLGARVETARRLELGAGDALLRSIVEATVTLFQANAASIALFDPPTGRLVFRVAAGEQGQGVVGLSIPPDQGLAGYVFSTGQALALSDVANDSRFGRATAEKTAYIPSSIVAVPLVDDAGTIGVLEVLDKRDSVAFSLRDVELAAVFARQAAVAISASRIERDTTVLLTEVLGRLAAADGGTEPGPAADRRSDRDAAAIAELVAAATADLGRDDESGLWQLVDLLARVRRADPEQVALVTDLLEVLASHAERAARNRRSARGSRTSEARQRRGQAAAADPDVD
jgi:signal transduction protein with GAF and PtsI domain